jgi:predicted nuclease of predicted toxin-antitoxin system
LQNKDRTSDNELRRICDSENRILITKDNDFFDSYILRKSPPQLLLISTGNIINEDLFSLFEKYFNLIITYFETYNFVELTNTELFGHE